MPNPKILFLVRDLRDVFASMEKKFRLNPDKDEGEINNITLQGITTQQRIEQWAVGHPIGYAVNKLNQSILDKSANNFFIIRYEDLCTNPEPVLNGIYNFFNIESYKHDFNKIDQITVEYTYDWIYNNFKWFFDTFKYNK